MRTVATAAAVAALSTLAAPAVGGILEPATPKAELATTGNDSERIKKLPISKNPGARQRVVMSLGPDQLKRIHAGDTIRAGGEVQVSTTCVKKAPKCIGRPYGKLNPTIAARIVLAPEPKADAPSLPLTGPSVTKRCKQRRPNRNHHCTLAIPNTLTPVPDPGGLPCSPGDCYVNMLVSASNRKAKKGNVVVLGADRPDGSVAQDKGRLNVVQARAEVPAPTESSSNQLVGDSLPLTEGKKEKRRVVYSLPIVSPRKGEVLAFDASFRADIARMRFNTFIASRVIVADSPTATSPNGVAKSSSLFRGQATEGNGFNCTLGRSGYTNPCTVVKSGATRITRDVADTVSGPGTLYLNVVGAGKPLLTEKIQGAPRIPVSAVGAGLTLHRYSP